MGEVVNLRLVRKRRKRAEDAERAAENRARHGRSGSEKERERRDADALVSHVDGHRRHPAEDEPRES